MSSSNQNSAQGGTKPPSFSPVRPRPKQPKLTKPKPQPSGGGGSGSSGVNKLQKTKKT